jgi:hypothetical protein
MPIQRSNRLDASAFIIPCQPTFSATVTKGDGWIHELKHDGFRILAFKDGEAVRPWSRNGRDWSREFVAIKAAVQALPFKRVMFERRGRVPLSRRPARLSPAPRRRTGYGSGYFDCGRSSGAR